MENFFLSSTQVNKIFASRRKFVIVSLLRFLFFFDLLLVGSGFSIVVDDSKDEENSWESGAAADEGDLSSLSAALVDCCSVSGCFIASLAAAWPASPALSPFPR